MNSLTKLLFYSFCQIKKPIVILEKDLLWKQIAGSGPGGQKINKTSNCVQLTHIPSGIIIKCQKSRNLETNKQYAYKFLKEKLDDHINGALSKKNQEIEKKIKQKLRRKRRSKQKQDSGNDDNIENNND